jgi:hypothetical protein
MQTNCLESFTPACARSITINQNSERVHNGLIEAIKLSQPCALITFGILEENLILLETNGFVVYIVSTILPYTSSLRYVIDMNPALGQFSPQAFERVHSAAKLRLERLALVL